MTAARSRWKAAARWLALVLALAASACRRGGDSSPDAPLRLAYFPNVTHAQALVGTAEGVFAEALGGAARLTTRQFNAGPAAMEALLAGDLDACYVGPGPAVIAYLRSDGALRVVAGATSGGAALVVRDARSPSDLAGKRVASPQLGNTQDIALRTWLRRNGLRIGEGAGEVHVTPLSNSDILQLFRRGDLAAAWVPEPWAARLVHESAARVLVDERTLWKDGRFPTTVLVATRRAIERRRGALVALLRAHLALTARWRSGRESFARAANAEYGRLTGHPLPEAVLQEAFSRMEATADPLREQLEEGARAARELGFAPAGDLSQLVDESLLAEARATARN